MGKTTSLVHIQVNKLSHENAKTQQVKATLEHRECSTLQTAPLAMPSAVP